MALAEQLPAYNIFLTVHIKQIIDSFFVGKLLIDKLYTGLFADLPTAGIIDTQSNPPDILLFEKLCRKR